MDSVLLPFFLGFTIRAARSEPSSFSDAGPVEGISPLRAETVTEDMGFGHLDATGCNGVVLLKWFSRTWESSGNSWLGLRDAYYEDVLNPVLVSLKLCRTPRVSSSETVGLCCRPVSSEQVS